MTGWQISQGTIKEMDDLFGERLVAEALGIAYELKVPPKNPNASFREICSQLAEGTPVRSFKGKMGRDRHDRWAVGKQEQNVG